MPTQFERTTVSFTAHQMKAMKRTVEEGKFPDLTEATRAAVNMFLDMRQFPTLWHWYQVHPECDFEADIASYMESSGNASLKIIRGKAREGHDPKTAELLSPVKVTS